VPELDAFDARVAGLLASVGPGGRRSLARVIAADLVKSQTRRIAAQQNPDGTPYEPRKPQPRLRRRKGGLRRAMFTRLRTARWMKREATPAAAVVTFAAGVQRLARVHQFGLRDRVNRTSLEVQYPARQLLGLTDAEIEAAGDAVIAHLAGA
jgi:phage virion morphogenesis protein